MQDTISVQGPTCVQKTVAVRVRKRVFRSHARATPAKFCKALQSSPVYFKAVRLCTSLWKAVQGFFHDDLWLADPKLIQADPKGIQADPSLRKAVQDFFMTSRAWLFHVCTMRGCTNYAYRENERDIVI